MYHHDYEIASTQVNAARELKLPSLLQILQDVATDGAAYSGIGTDVTYSKGLLWVISRMEIDIVKMPAYEQKITVYTYPGKTLVSFYPRHFVVYDENKNLLLRASSIWALIHKDTRKMEMHDQFPWMSFDQMDGELPRPKRLAPLTDEPILEERKIRYSDVDLNSHLNNTRYIEMVDDLCDGKEHASRTLKHVTLNYERELHEGDVLVLRGHTGLTTEITGFCNEKPAFEAKMEYELWTPNR